VLVEPFRLDAEGCLAVPQRPGLGVEPDPEKLRRHSRELTAA
jgi:L-alanine-DL-glutamate epimerase-like enolase superfamily enzyme